MLSHNSLTCTLSLKPSGNTDPVLGAHLSPVNAEQTQAPAQALLTGWWLSQTPCPHWIQPFILGSYWHTINICLLYIQLIHIFILFPHLLCTSPRPFVVYFEVLCEF